MHEMRLSASKCAIRILYGVDFIKVKGLCVLDKKHISLFVSRYFIFVLCLYGEWFSLAENDKLSNI